MHWVISPHTTLTTSSARIHQNCISTHSICGQRCGKSSECHMERPATSTLQQPVNLGMTLDRTLAYKSHILKPRAKVSLRNAIVRKLTHFKWGANPSTVRTTALALSYSAAEYACPVWERSTQLNSWTRHSMTVAISSPAAWDTHQRSTCTHWLA